MFMMMVLLERVMSSCQNKDTRDDIKLATKRTDSTEEYVVTTLLNIVKGAPTLPHDVRECVCV